MRARWPLLAAFLALGVAYVAYPYATLLRLGLAVQSANATTLQHLVNWPAVREGIKEDVCDLGAVPQRTAASASLPPFGASFVRGIASNTIDQAVTPQALVDAAGLTSPNHEGGKRLAHLHVNWAFFESPTTFLVSLQSPGQAEPIRLEMDLTNGVWRVDRVWLPEAMLRNGGART